MLRDEYKFSIIIPVLNEASAINSLIRHIRGQERSDDCEIIVVDGESDGRTVRVIADKDVVKLRSETGRAKQMNTGATVARGRILIFLHADTKLPPEALVKIDHAMQNRETVGGAFDLGIDSDRLSLKFIAARASFRSRVTHIPYGDQAIFIRKDYFDKIGRYKEIPLMEDIDLMQRVKRNGGRIFILRDRVRTSARRWEKEGVFYTTLKNMLLVNLYRLGVSPERLAGYYRNHSRPTRG